MKKILFVAMATIAFAGTSFAANEVVEKEVSDAQEISTKTESAITGGEQIQCAAAAVDYTERIKKNSSKELTQEQISVIRGSYYMGCMDEMTGGRNYNLSPFAN